MLNTSPAFNLKAVLLETGLAADTLRAWERRYGVPSPQRTAGGHRLYSQYDIETIKWLIARQAEGLSISRAVDLWNEQLASGSDPLAALAPTSTVFTQTVSANPPADATLDGIRSEWINACINFSEAQAEQALNKAFSIFPVEAVCVEVLQKGMAGIGDLWYENHASVQQEHFASGLAMRRLNALLSASPAPTRAQTVLIGCPSNEWHTFTPLLLALFLRRRGLNVIYLGANVPTERFSETAQKVKANLVILVAQTLHSAAYLQHAALALTTQKIGVGFGGRVFNIRPAIVEHIPGQYLGTTLEGSINEIESLLKGISRPHKVKAAAQEYISALHGFNAKRSHIESALKQSLPPLSIGTEDLDASIQHLGHTIAAALQFGDMEHLSEEMEWLKVLLQSHNRPKKELTYFMESYSNAVDANINGQGDPIKKWLHMYATERT
ncbi:hypothetical protein MASR2M66_28180 [Chloroflexota bacterium]